MPGRFADDLLEQAHFGGNRASYLRRGRQSGLTRLAHMVYSRAHTHYSVPALVALSRMNDPSSPLRSEGQGATPEALSVEDDTREAWSCPLPNEIFTVGSQGRDEEIAGVVRECALPS